MACDLQDGAAVQQVVRRYRPDVIVHAAAMTDVDACECSPREAIGANVLATYLLARAAQRRGCWLLALSTDYVFDGARRTSPYPETAAPHPVSVYGRTKLLAEVLVDTLVERAMVIRTSTLFGPGRATFVDAVVARASRGERVEAYRDQVTSPTYTVDAAEGIERMITALFSRPATERLAWRGIYHLTNAGGATRVELALAVLRLAGYPASLVRPIRMAQQRRPAPRPRYCALAGRRFIELVGAPLRPWEQALEAYWQWKRSSN